jgi:nucleoside-diphosphate-sugar epimerase
MLKVDGGQANAGLLYVDNLVDYLIWAASSEKSLGQCYNVRDSYDVTWAEFIDVFGNALHAKSIVINLPFGLAIFLAKVVEAVYLRLAPSREPFLHRMLVNTFGRTCGHGAAKIMAHSGKVGTVDFALAIERSVNWYLE